MFENIFKSKEHPTEEEIRAGLEEKEKSLKQEALGAFENLEKGNVKKEAVSALLALSLFVSASSAFASEQGAESIALPDMGEETITQSLKKMGVKNDVADFDWKKTVGKIELSIDSKIEDIPMFDGESIGTWGQGSSEFFKDTTIEQINQTHHFIYQAISISHNAEEFNTNLSVLSQEGEMSLNEKQKIIAVQQFTSLLGATYNYDMLNAESFVGVLDDTMFQAMKDKYYGRSAKSGICTNIHLAALGYAKAMGIESFMQTGGTDRGAHAWMGMVVGEGDQREIIFNDYGTLIRTGQDPYLDYKRSMSAFEKYNGVYVLFSNKVGNEKEVFFPVDSKASEAVKEAAGIESPTDILKKNLEKGGIAHEERGLYIDFSEEVKSVKLNAGTAIVSFTKLNGEQDPAQSLKSMDALHLGLNLQGETLGVHHGAQVGVTMVEAEIKGFNDRESTFQSDFIGTLMVDALLKGELPETMTKQGYGNMVAELGAVFTGAARTALGSEGKLMSEAFSDGISEDNSEANAEFAFGGRIMYIDPTDTTKVFLDASWHKAPRTNNFEDQQNYLKTVAQNIAVGGEVKVYEGTVVNMEVGKSNNEWGKGESLKMGVKGDTIEANIDYTKNESDFERFVPSSEEIKVGVSAKVSSTWEVGIYGTKTTEQYKDAQKKDTTDVQLKVRMLLM